MASWLTKKIVKYFREKTIAQINADPIGVAREHYKPIIDDLAKDGKIVALYWGGSYEYNMRLIEFFKGQPSIDNYSFDTNEFEKDSESDKIIDVFLVENDGLGWSLAFYEDVIALNKGLVLLDKFSVNVASNEPLGSEIVTRLI